VIEDETVLTSELMATILAAAFVVPVALTPGPTLAIALPAAISAGGRTDMNSRYMNMTEDGKLQVQSLKFAK
jgi:hypothetical protein